MNSKPSIFPDSFKENAPPASKKARQFWQKVPRKVWEMESYKIPTKNKPELIEFDSLPVSQPKKRISKAAKENLGPSFKPANKGSIPQNQILSDFKAPKLPTLVQNPPKSEPILDKPEPLWPGDASKCRNEDYYETWDFDVQHSAVHRGQLEEFPDDLFSGPVKVEEDEESKKVEEVLGSFDGFLKATKRQKIRYWY